MKKYTLLLITLFFASQSFAQLDFKMYSDQAFVYKLTNEQALLFAKATNITSDPSAIFSTQTPFDTLVFTERMSSYNLPARLKYPTGHYVVVLASGEYLNYEFLSFNDIGIVPIQHKKNFQFYVVDTVGNFVTADKITLDGKDLKQKEGQFYEFKKFKNKRLLIIQKGEQVVFYEIQGNHYSNGNWFVRKWERITNWNIWYNPWYALGNMSRRIYMPFVYFWTPKTYGYVTTNKPKYLPQDTVKIKAYLTRDNKIPYNTPLTLKITNYNNFKFEKTIKPTSKGSYVFDFPLGDSLQLDRQYQVEFWKGKQQLIQTYFNYEDYQLDEISYNLRSDKTAFKRYEPIIFYAEGKDKNGQNVMDGDVEITALINNPRAFYEKYVLIPDTLFHYKGALEVNGLNGGEMRFPLPKETIPMADFNILVKAVFTNANGELHEKTLNLGVISDSTLIDLRLDGDTLLVDYRVNGKSVPAIGKLDFGLKSSNFRIEKTVQFPYKEVLNPVFEYISAYANGSSNILNFNGYENDLLTAPTFDLVQTGDSVFVFGYNPSGLEVNYEIYRINRKIEKGNSDERLIIWKDKVRQKTSYRIDYEYIMNGVGRQGSQHFNYAENQLTIEIDQPNVVQPGQTIDVKVKVKTAKNNDAKNVNLVAGAVNTQFGNINNWKYNVPFIGETSTKGVGRFQSVRPLRPLYKISPYKLPFWRDTITENYRKAFDLDRFVAYKLLFADDGYYEKSWNVTSDSTHAQFAPLIVKNGHFQESYLIYANRKLVYFKDTETPYSFQGQAGYNTIVIRGRDFEIQMDSVYLKNGEKLVFSIDLEDLPKHAKVFPRANKYTSAERALLQKSILTYRRTGSYTSIYVWQDEVIYHTEGKTTANFGPFTSTENLTMIKKNQFQTEFKFEPGFIYEIEKTRERLYHNPSFPDERMVQIGTIQNGMNFRDTILFNKNIAVFDKKGTMPLIKRQLNAIFRTVPYQTGGKVSYQIQNFQYGKDSTHYFFFFVNKKTNKKYFFNSHTTFRNVNKGDYTLYGYTVWGNYFTHDVTIRQDTMLYEYLENIDYKKDSNLTLLKSIMAIPEIILPVETPAIGENTPTNSIKYSGRTYSISGTVTDENGEAVIATTVLIKGTKIGTLTDLDGNYTLEIPEEIKNPILVFSYIGLNSQEVTIGTNTNFDIVMEESQDALDEIVVVGYGTVKKEQMVSASIERVPSLSSKDIPVLMGNVAGVSSKEEALTIRGSRSDGMDYSIDGIKVTGDTLNFSELEASSKIRSRFQDYAFWQPNLITDRNGEATFRVTYPDNITAYQTFVLGMDRKQNFGIATKNVQSKKTALAQLAVPRFLIQGDKANIIGKSLNYSNDSLRIKSTFLFDENVLKTNDFWLTNLQVETAEIVANTDKDTLELTYKMEHVSRELGGANFFDGEKRPIPIYRKGVEETVGSFNILTGDTTVVLTFDKDKGNVKIYAQTDILEVLLKDVEYLVNYPYGCNEQTASRLLALLMDKQIKASLGQEKPKDEPIIAMVKRLEKAQNPDGSWGWWQGNSKNYWMTNYVLKALHAADTSGYKSASYETGLRFITNSLSQMNGQDLLNAVELLSDIQQNMAYEKHIAALDSQITKKDIYSQLIITKIKQQQGLQYDLTILDTLEKQTLFGNIFYEIDNSKTWNYGYRYWYRNDYNLTVLAYQLLKNSPENAAKLAAISGYFLEKRTNYGWQNTFTTATILATILPDIANISNKTKPQLIIKGNTTETVTKFPFETTFYANTDLEIQKTGTSTVYLTGYQQFWNEKPKPKNDIFELKTELKQENKTVKKLEAKTPTKMVVTLEVKKEAEFVMVEVPIPAGCSYGEKSGNYGWYGREAYREYFREKTCVFYQNLPVGTYTIEINLEPRFTGEYTVNPAKAEQMYFPVFYGRNGLKVVEIEE